MSKQPHSKNESFLRIGDELYFYDQNHHVLVAENPLETRACVKPTMSHFTSSHDAMGISIFNLEPHQSYSAQRDLNLFLSDGDRDLDTMTTCATLEEIKELQHLQSKATKEIAQNETEKRRLLGKPVLYGQVIQLFNSHFKKYLCVTGKTTTGSNNHLKVNLSDQSVGYFRIMPRYRIRFVGDKIRLGDTIALQCVRPEGYLNVDYTASNNSNGSLLIHDNYYQVYSHTRISSWTMKLHYSSVTDQDTQNVKYTNSGQYVRLYHKEMEAYLEAPANSSQGNEVVLKKHVINPLDPKETDSPLAFWEIENVDISRGSKVRWKKSIRIRHVASRAYLSIDPSHVRIDLGGQTTFTLRLLKNPPIEHQDTTLFQFIPISTPAISGIPYGSFVRIQHVVTGCWMHAAAANDVEKDSERSEATNIANIPVVLPQVTLSPSSSLKTSHHHQHDTTSNGHISQDTSHSRFSSFTTLIEEEQPIKATNDEEEEDIFRITASQELYYHDCFSITCLDQELSDTFNIANEMLPPLQHYLAQDRFVQDDENVYQIHDVEYETIVDILKALIKFCTNSKENNIAKREGLPNEYHQTLLRDIGIIEAIIQIITVPFDLEKRKQVRDKLLHNKHSFVKLNGPVKGKETVVTTANMNDKLRSILTLSYHLLRVFLVKRSSFEEPNTIAQENQHYILSVAGKSGMALFIQHVSCDVGATDVLIKLLSSASSNHDRRSSHGDSPIYDPAFLVELINTAKEETQALVDVLNEKVFVEEEEDDEERWNQKISCLRLLSALCRSSSITNASNKITEALLNPKKKEGLLQTKIANPGNQVKIRLGNDDTWCQLQDVVQKPPSFIFLDHLLELIYSVSNETHATTVHLTSQCVPREVCYFAIKNTKLPSKIRSRFCDILRAVYVDIADIQPIALSDFTIDFQVLPFYELDYSYTYITDSDFFKKMTGWTFQFLDARRHEFIEKTEDVQLLNSVLELIHTQLKLGFFAEPRQVALLFHVLVHVLDGRTDARNEAHLKYIRDKHTPRDWPERYSLTEENQLVMHTKIQILDIFDLIFDLRLHVRMSHIANLWYHQIGDGMHEQPMTKSLKLKSLLAIFQETQLQDRKYGLIPILKDILKYQYAPLQQVAVVVMHRLFNDSQELLKIVPNVVVLNAESSPQSLVYSKLQSNLKLLSSYTFNIQSDDPKQHLENIQTVIKDSKDLLETPPPAERRLDEWEYAEGSGNDDEEDWEMADSKPEKADKKIDGYDYMGDPSIYCRVFKTLDAGNLMVNVLKSLLNIPEKFYHEYIDTIQLCLELLCIVTKHDKEFQSRFVLYNIDLLIDINLLSPKLAVTFSQLCSNNLYLSMHIKEEHIIRIINTSEGAHADYLLVLHDLLKTQGKLIKKNQDIVMRFIMENRTNYIPFNNTTSMLDTLRTMNEDQISYCSQLISILAICGQGENTFGQSFARTIFSIGDIYEVIQDDDAPYSLKASVLKFLASIYIEDVELPLDIPTTDNHNILKVMEIAESAMIRCLYEQQDLLPKDFSYYVYRGIPAFLRSVFEYHISIETTMVDQDKMDFYTRLADLSLKLLRKTYGDAKMQAMLTCLDSMINVAGFRGTMDPKALHDLLKEATSKLDKLYARDGNYHHYAAAKVDRKSVPIKDQINVAFQSFFKNIKSSAKLREYQKSEFQKLCSHFSLDQPNGKDSIKSLIAYLNTMTTTKVDKRIEYYQVATIKVLEDISMQYIHKRMQLNPHTESALYEEVEAKKSESQNTLNSLGCTLVAQNLLSSPRRKIFDAALKLLISLLEGGNKNVQDELEKYFYSLTEERFFYSFHQRLQNGISSLKEAHIHMTRKIYKMNRQQYIMDNIALSDAQQQSNKTRKAQQNRRSKSILVASKNTNTKNSPDSSKRNSHLLVMGHKRTNSAATNAKAEYKTSSQQQQQQPLSEESAKLFQEISQIMVANSESTAEFGGTTTKDYKVMEDTMRTLQLMVEGHNLNLQAYLAKQPDNIKSFNIVLDVVEYSHAIVPLCNASNIELIIQVLDTITELAQGCLENQVTIFNGKVINPINIILRESYHGCDSKQVKELKSKVVICLLSLLEGGMENSETIYREMIDSLDLATVKNNMEIIYKDNLGNLSAKNVFEKLECGFLYCILVMTLAPALDQEQSAMFLENNEAFEYFQSHTGHIEILMDYGQEKQLTRVLFPIPEICQYLREETKQRFLWNAKRESPSAKIEDFVQQSEMIIYEIENQAHVAHNKYQSFLTEYNALWWKLAYGVSILINILLMLHPNLLLGDGNPIKIMTFASRYILSLIHLVLWLLLTAEFYYIQLPVLVNRRMQENAVAAGVADKFLMAYASQNSKLSRFLLATITESRFLYHVLMVVFSLAGLTYSPGFYSLHLLDFVFRDSVLQGVISSITLNSHSISRTAILGIIVIYIHSIIAYMYFRKEFDDSKGLFCGSLLECFMTVLSHGVRSGGGIGDILEPDELGKPSGWRTIFEMSFYLVVVVFLLNAIFGIIFDTFGHLRDERSSIQQDMKNSCFICSIPAVEFQRHAKKGFEDHVKNDHNIWQYLFFLVHLRNKDPTEYTGPESYVAGCLKDADYSFFPINRALGLDKEKDDTERLDKLEELNQPLLEKLAKLEEHIDKLGDQHLRSRQNSLLLSPL